MMLKLIRAFLRPQLDFADAGGGATAGFMNTVGALTMPRPDYWRPQGMEQADAEWMRAMQAISAATDRNTGIVDPNLLQSYSQLMGIDLTGLVRAGATAGGQYAQAGQMAGDFSAGARGRGDAIWNAAADPRQEIHDFQRQQTIDSSRSADASRGIAMGGASSGNESTALRGFEMDWRNAQLGRELAGNQGAGQAYGQAMNYSTMQPQLTQASATAPVAGQMAAYGLPMDFSNQFLQSEANMMQPNFNMMQNTMPYMGFGWQAGSNQYDQNLARHMAQFGMFDKAIGQATTGYRGQSGMGDPMQWMTMGGSGMMPGGGGGGGGGGGEAFGNYGA